ncbi:MAG: hypothetical protein NC828_03320 [Candidatus Omnitrophica bacterium]|nr:hypothetical protein [Candidatus Omnitrophota bacterium]
MPTEPRLLLKGTCYHIITRSNQRQGGFQTIKDCRMVKAAGDYNRSGYRARIVDQGVNGKLLDELHI